MICELCHKREAQVFYKSVWNVCAKCNLLLLDVDKASHTTQRSIPMQKKVRTW